MLRKVGLAIIGCGRVAYSHLFAIRELNHITKLVATISRTKKHAQKAAKEFGAKRYYTSLDDAFGDSEIDAVIVCLPHYLHADACVRAAESGKHILVEKPMANTVKEAKKMIDTASRNRVILMVGQSRRFYNAVLESKKCFDRGEIGDIIDVNAILFGYMDKPSNSWWRSEKKTGGLIIPLWGSHIIDYILWLSGKIPKRVYAESYSYNPNWEGEDEASILMGFEGGMMASVVMSWNARLVEISKLKGEGKILPTPEYNRYIIGTKGIMYLKGETELFLNRKKLVSGEQKPSNFHLQIKEFVTSILEDREPLASGKEVLKVIQVMEASRISAKEHRMIELG